MTKDRDGQNFHDDKQHLTLCAVADVDACEDAFTDAIDGDHMAAAETEAQTRRPDRRAMGATSRRLRKTGGAPLANRASIDWRSDNERVCQARAPGHRIEKDGVYSLSQLTATLLFSRTAAALYAELEKDGISIVYDVQTPLSQYYPRDTKAGARHLITLNPNHPKGDLLNLMARELRRAWQHAKGALVNPLSFEPDEAILVNRAQQADVLMMSIKMAWELKLAGENEAWDYLVGSPMADVSRMFEGKASTDFRTLNNGEAARATYDQFFEGTRTKMYDKRIIHQMLLDETGYIKSREKRPQIGMDLFQRLGQLPNGRNYLSSGAQKRLPTDPAYASVEDRANANFLWFIKFERSFQEKELQMIEESVKLSAEVVDLASFAARRAKGARENA